MSATNRGAKRRKADFYATPKEAFAPLIPFLTALPSPIWEPACGDGRLVTWMREAGIQADGDDLNRGYDFLSDVRTHSGTIVTNPPFSLALEFCDQAIKAASSVLMLLRLNFLASQRRKGWWSEHRPSALFVLSNRPSFTEDGGTDATDYAWFYWGNMYHGMYFL